jgi:hypothetical protein
MFNIVLNELIKSQTGMTQWVHPTPRLPIGQFEFLSTPSVRRRLRIDDEIYHLTTIQGLGAFRFKLFIQRIYSMYFGYWHVSFVVVYI